MYLIGTLAHKYKERINVANLIMLLDKRKGANIFYLRKLCFSVFVLLSTSTELHYLPRKVDETFSLSGYSVQ